jgi:hypothetical protein
MIREAISDSIQRGEPIPDIKLRNKTRTDATQPSTPPKKNRDEPTR